MSNYAALVEWLNKKYGLKCSVSKISLVLYFEIQLHGLFNWYNLYQIKRVRNDYTWLLLI